MPTESMTIRIEPSEDFKNYVQELSKDIKELIESLKKGDRVSVIYEAGKPLPPAVGDWLPGHGYSTSSLVKERQVDGSIHLVDNKTGQRFDGSGNPFERWDKE